MTSKKRYRTAYLFPKTSTLIGIGSAISMFGNYYEFNFCESGKTADARALENDWNVIGSDFRKALNKKK